MNNTVTIDCSNIVSGKFQNRASFNSKTLEIVLTVQHKPTFPKIKPAKLQNCEIDYEILVTGKLQLTFSRIEGRFPSFVTRSITLYYQYKLRMCTSARCTRSTRLKKKKKKIRDDEARRGGRVHVPVSVVGRRLLTSRRLSWSSRSLLPRPSVDRVGDRATPRPVTRDWQPSRTKTPSQNGHRRRPRACDSRSTVHR